MVGDNRFWRVLMAPEVGPPGGGEAPEPTAMEETEPVAEEPEADGGTDEDSNETEGDAPAQADSVLDPASDDSETNDGEEGEPEPDKPTLEGYEAFKMPDGVTLDEKAMEQAAPVLLGIGLDQEQAQKVVDLYAGLQATQMNSSNQSIEDQRVADVELLKSHEILGGTAAEYKAAMKQAGRAMSLEGAEGALGLLRAHGIDNDPVIVSLFHTIGGMIAEDSVSSGKGSAGTGVRSEDAMFPSTVVKK